MEITNEGRGWHLHSHWLLDVRWLDIAEVARVWGEIVGQSYGVVKIKDVRNGEYLQELLKYVAKGSDLVKWSDEQLLEFVTAIKGNRFFFCFGSLFKMGDEIRQQLKFMRREKKACECGACDWQFETERQTILNEIRKARRK